MEKLSLITSDHKREVWHFEQARADLIKRSIESFNWEKSFADLEVDQQVDLLTSTLLNIFRNFIPHETVNCKDKNPPWMTKRIKSSLQRKNRMYKKYISRGMKADDKVKFEEQNTLCESLITESKSRYFANLSRKLVDPLTSPKSYWSTLNRFTGRGKLPVIPPLNVNGELVTDFTRKANLFNDFFAEQCSTLNNDSTLPEFSFLTQHRISEVELSSQRISKIISDLNPNKARGFDNISIKMIQLCGDTIVFPLKLIFTDAMSSGIFPNKWKKGNITPVHKKSSKQLIKNYRPISLLPIFAKIFEKLIYDSLYKYLHNNKVLSEKQSGFRPGDSCVNQLIAISHEIFKSFDGKPSLETRGVFLDMSKAFDKVWHKGLLFKLKRYGIHGNLFKILENYLSNRQQ